MRRHSWISACAMPGGPKGSTFSVLSRKLPSTRVENWALRWDDNRLRSIVLKLASRGSFDSRRNRRMRWC